MSINYTTQRVNYQYKKFSRHGTTQRSQQDHRNNVRAIRSQAGYHHGKKCFDGIVASQFKDFEIN